MSDIAGLEWATQKAALAIKADTGLTATNCIGAAKAAVAALAEPLRRGMRVEELRTWIKQQTDGIYRSSETDAGFGALEAFGRTLDWLDTEAKP